MAINRNGLSDDLARYCLEPDAAESVRQLAWVNSVCLAFIVMGILGLKPQPVIINKRPVTQEDAAPTVIEPLVAAVQTVNPDSTAEEASSDQPTDAGSIVAVVADSPAVAFSVPTVGNTLVSLNMAQAPPAHPMQAAVAVSAPRIEQINITGTSGSRPAPPYPMESLRPRETGTVLLLIEVDVAGKITSVTVKQSSGYSRLDNATVDYVRRHWFFSAGDSQRLYESPIVFQLR